MSIQYNKYANAQVQTQALADEITTNLKNAIETKGQAVLAVSGGRSPIALFQVLSQKDLAWDKVFITLVDERIVPIDHADSNTGLVRQYLLQGKANVAHWLPMIDDDATIDSLKDIAKAVDFACAAFKQPDVLILGMGNDGHTASIFPQAPQLEQALSADYSPLLLHTTPVTAAHERISMSLKAIENTAKVYLAIAGAEKRQVYEQAAQQPSREMPVSFVLHSNKVVCHVYDAE